MTAVTKATSRVNARASAILEQQIQQKSVMASDIVGIKLMRIRRIAGRAVRGRRLSVEGKN